MTLTDDLHDTAAALRSGWPITNLNRARRVRAAKELQTMGTRGTYSFISGGRHLTGYNHFDSYASCLGARIVDDIADAVRNDKLGELRALIAAARIVGDSESDAPTSEDVARCEAAEAVDLRVSSKSLTDWYVLTRRVQPSQVGIWPVLRLGLIYAGELGSGYGYTVDLDAMTFTAIAYGRAFSRPLATIETWRETWVDEFDGAEVSK